jgi:hypothetical protein
MYLLILIIKDYLKRENLYYVYWENYSSSHVLLGRRQGREH